MKICNGLQWIYGELEIGFVVRFSGFTDCDPPYVDHTVMENITRFKNDYEQSGRHMKLIGLEHHFALSDHPLAARKNQRVTVLS